MRVAGLVFNANTGSIFSAYQQMYLVTMQPSSGKLVRFEMVPFQIKRFRLNHVSGEDARWLERTMNTECARFGGRVELSEAKHLELHTVEAAVSPETLDADVGQGFGS